MEYYINESGQVMRKTIGDTFIEETHFGFEKQVQSIDLQERTIYQWQKFDLTQSKYVVDSSNATPIKIGGTEYVPTNGAVEIMKSTIIKPEANEEIANAYEAAAALDNRATNLEGRM